MAIDLRPISFSMQAKEEIASLDFPPLPARAFLSGFVKTVGTLRISGGVEEIDLATESAKVANLLYKIARLRYGVAPRFAYTRQNGKKKKTRYHVLIKGASEILDDLKIDFLSGKIDPEIIADQELSSCYLSGAFCASGSVNDPISSNYHLEIAASSQEYAKSLQHLANKILSHHFNFKVIKRRNQSIVYLKRSDLISEFLVLIGATASCLQFEGVRIDRDESNIGNRQINLDTANMEKTLATGRRQCEKIEYVIKHKGREVFPNEKMAALMDLRLSHPESSLSELAELLSEELSTTISKSNVNHLFRLLDEIYKSIGGEDE